MTSPNGRVTIDVRLDRGELRAALERDVRSGLTAEPKTLPPKWFYDARGSALFEAITRLPEYYPTRAERSILEARATEIAAITGAETLVELGSGTSEKTRLLLDALRDARLLHRFVPFDVSEPTLRAAADAIAAEYPGIDVHAVVGDFDHHLGAIPDGGPRLVAFLGGTIGNLDPPERFGFLRSLRGRLHGDDSLLLGTDLVKSAARLEAAYDDPQGVTAEFNRNVLHVLNRELHADFRPADFEHIARWVPEEAWIEMRLRSTRAQRVRVDDLGLEVRFAAGEEMRTEISAKFTLEGVAGELRAAGFEPVASWTDRAGDFALFVSRPTGA